MLYRSILEVGTNTKLATNKYHKQAALRLVGPALRLTRIIFECSGVRNFRKYYDSSR